MNPKNPKPEVKRALLLIFLTILGINMGFQLAQFMSGNGKALAVILFGAGLLAQLYSVYKSV